MAKEVLDKVPQENWDNILSRLPLASAFRAASELHKPLTPERQAYANVWNLIFRDFGWCEQVTKEAPNPLFLLANCLLDAYHGKPLKKRAPPLVLIFRNAKRGNFLNDQFLESCLRPYSEDEDGIMTFDNGVQLWRGPFWMHDFVIENLVSHLFAFFTSKLYFVKWNDKDNGISEITLKNKYNQMNTNCAYFGFLKKPLLPHWGFLVRQSTLYSE